MAQLLKEIFGIREMSIEVPDEHLPKLRNAVNGAVKSGELPDNALSWFFPQQSKGGDQAKKDDAPAPTSAAAKKPAAPAPKAAPQAKPTAKATDRTLKVQPSADASVRAWDAMGGKSQPQKPAPKAVPKFDPSASDADYDLPRFGDQPSATVKSPAFLGAGEDEPDDGEYRSPFAGVGIDTGDDYGDRMGVGGPSAPSLKGPGLASRAKGALSRIFSTDPKKKMDRTMRKMDKDAQKAAKPQGTLSRLIRGKDVTR